MPGAVINAQWFCGWTLQAGGPGRVLFVYSVPFCRHQRREQGGRVFTRFNCATF